MAPEVLQRNKYSEKADVYSFGIVLWEVFTGLRPYSDGEFQNMNQAQLMFNILENNARPPLEGMDAALQQLIVDCWNVDPKLRPSFSEAVVRLRRLKEPDNFADFLAKHAPNDISDTRTEEISPFYLSDKEPYIN